jgi:hypothetical protein
MLARYSQFAIPLFLLVLSEFRREREREENSED